MEFAICRLQVVLSILKAEWAAVSICDLIERRSCVRVLGAVPGINGALHCVGDLISINGRVCVRPEHPLVFLPKVLLGGSYGARQGVEVGYGRPVCFAVSAICGMARSSAASQP